MSIRIVYTDGGAVIQEYIDGQWLAVEMLAFQSLPDDEQRKLSDQVGWHNTRLKMEVPP